MKTRYFCEAFALISLLLIGTQPVLAQEDPMANEPGFPPQLPPEPRIPGTVEGTGTCFQVTDSEYLNITLDSTQPVKLRLESIPGMVILDIQAAEGASSTQLTLSGFTSYTTFYKYEDDYHSGVPFTTDANGSYTYVQDLSEPHHVFIQPNPSTKFIPSDTQIGTWDPLSRVYTLTTDVNESIQIDQGDLTLDGNGHAVTGAGTGIGTYVPQYEMSVSVKNLTVQNFSQGVVFWKTPNSTIENVAVLNSSQGLILSYSGGIMLRNNTVLGHCSHSGIWLGDSPGSTLASNAVSHCAVGIGVSRSEATNLTNNSACSSYGGYPATYGIYITDSPDSILTGNTADSNGQYGILLVGSDRSILEDNTANYNASWGIRLASNQCRLTGNRADSNLGGGIHLWVTTDCSLTGNSASLNRCASSDYPAGIYLQNCSGCALTRNLANANQLWGIYLLECSSSTLTQNIASSNWCGILLSSGAGNTITGNLTHSNGSYGIAVSSSSNNILTGNTSCHNEGYGISVYGDNNQIYSNIFIGNGTQARLYSGMGNVFNLDPPTGGNYWSDWTGPDENGDGFVDSSYVFDGGRDDYPLADKDSDGIGDNVENGAPNGGDGNSDGILDSQQDNVASLPNAENGQYTTLASPDGTQLADVIAFGNPSPGDAPPGVDFPIGFLSFTVQGIAPGGSVDVTLFPPAGEAIASYYKYGPTKNSLEDHWYEFIFEGQTGAEILSDRVILHFIDGDEGDDDLQANAEVVEPGAPAFARYTRLAFLPPLGPDNKRVFKQRSTIPVKFRIADAEGNPVPDALATLAVYYLEDGAPDGQADVISTAAGDWGNQFRYDPDDDLYIFNLSTKDPSFFDWFTYRIVATLDGGQTLEVDFSLK